jgi:hypothetical protein
MASADGWFYMFDVNTQDGGICKLLTQASIYTPNPTLFLNNPNLGNNNLVNNTIVNNTNPNFNINNDDNHHNHHHQQSFHPQQQTYENQHMDS